MSEVPADLDPASPEAIAGAERLFSDTWGSLACDGTELEVWRRADGRCVLRESSAHDANRSDRCVWLTEEQARAEIDAFRATAERQRADEAQRASAQAAQPATAGDTATFVGAILGLVAFLALVALVISRRS